MRILLIAPFGSGQHYWGPGTSAYNLYRNLDRTGVTVSLLHGFPNQPIDSVFEEQYFISEINPKNPISTAVFLFKVKIWMRKNVKKFDIVHALSGFHYSFLPAYWAERLSVPSFVKLTAAGAGFNNEGTFSKLLGLRAWRHRKRNIISGYIAISKDIVSELLLAGIDANRIHYLPNGVDVERFFVASETEKRRLRIKYNVFDKFTCLFVGGISSRKNPSKIVDALCLLKGMIDIQLILVGPSREADNIEQSLISEGVERCMLQDNILQFGHTTKIEDFYQLADVFILPSDNEGMSNALLEAMSTGLPVIVTKVSGTSDLVTNGHNGFIVKKEPGNIAQAIKQLNCLDTRKQFGDNSRKIIEKNFSSAFVLNQHVKIFNDAISRVGYSE